MNNNTIVCGSENTDRCIIWLHGLGSSGCDLADGIWPSFPDKIRSNWRAIFPNAPQLPVTISGGFIMPAWFDIYSITDRSKEDLSGFDNALKILQSIIAEQVDSGIQPHNIVVAGFSQGGVIALYSLLQQKLRLGGILSLSAYLPLGALNNVKQSHRDTNIMLMHGKHDYVIGYNALDDAREKLQQLGYQPQTKSYDMAHEICTEQISDITDFLMHI